MPRINLGRRTLISGQRPMRSVALTSVLALLLGLMTAAPLEAGSAPSPIIVDRVDDSAAGSASACTGAANDCSLRGASLYANAHTGQPTFITLPAGNYQLTIAGSPTETNGMCGSASVGDLDFTATNTVLTGAGAATTTIQQTTADRVMCLNPALTFAWHFTMSGVTITGGNTIGGLNLDVNGAAGLLSGGRFNTTNLSDCIFTGNTSTGGQYGGAIGNFGGDLTVTNCTFTNNTSNNSGGGAISYTSGDPTGNHDPANPIPTLPGASGTLTVTNSTFTNNTANGSGGGAIDIHQANLSTTNATIAGSTFTSNKAPNGSGGAIEIETGDTISITKSTFTSNTAHETGGAIYNGGVNTTLKQDTFVSNSLTNPTVDGGGGAIGQPQGSTTVQYSRFSGNTNASPGQAKNIYVTGGTFVADDNWWGQNTGPAASGDVVGTTPATWLQLRHTPNVSNVLLGGVASLSADIRGRNSGGPIPPSNLVGLAAFPASGVFGNSIKGTLSGASTQFVSGQATATWQAGVTTADCGAGGADAVADSQTVTAHITVRCPDLTGIKTNDKSGSVVVGESWTWTITIANGGDADGTFTAGQVVLFDQLPSTAVSYGTPASSNSNVTCAIDGSQNLTCSVSASHTLTMAPADSFTVTVTSTGTAPGSAANPRAAGTCAVDSDTHVVESDEGNNTCANAVTVSKAATTTTITSDSPDPSLIGATVTVIYHVAVNAPGAGAPTGEVTVGDGTDSCHASVSAGTCDVTLHTLGLRPLTASYPGDTNFLPSTSSPGTPHEVDGPPSINSADHATFRVGTAGSFTITTIAGYPTATTISKTGALPTGVTFSDNGNGTATLSGTPGVATHGTYPLTITATNGIGTDPTQSFTLAVNEPPSISSTNHTTFTVGSPGTFSVTTAPGYPADTTLSLSGDALPSGVTFVDNGNGTASLAGTPAAGTAGTYHLTITASNGVSPDATQGFTLTVDESVVVPPPPTPGPLLDSLRTGGTQVKNRLGGRLDWSSGSSSTASVSPVTYDLQVRTKRASSWTRWQTLRSGLTATHVKRGFFINVWYQFRVRAVRSDSPSGWSVGRKFRPQVVDDRSAAITYVGTWTQVSDASAYGGTRHTTTTVGDSAQVTLSGHAVSVVMPTGPGYGIALICVDQGQPGEVCHSVDLSAYPSTARRTVFNAGRLHAATHVLRITLAAQGVIGLAIDVNALIR